MEAPILDALSKVYKPDKLQVINPPPLAIGAGNVDVDEDDEDAGDIENNAEEEIEKVVAAVDGEEEDGEYVGDDDDGGQGGDCLFRQLLGSFSILVHVLAFCQVRFNYTTSHKFVAAELYFHRHRTHLFIQE